MLPSHAPTHRVCRQQGVNYVNSIFEFQDPAIGHILLYQALEGVLFIVLTILIEVSYMCLLSCDMCLLSCDLCVYCHMICVLIVM